MSITQSDYRPALASAYLPNMGLWERIRLARDAAGLSQTQLGRLVRVKQNTVSRWEKQGDNVPDLAQIEEIASATGVRVEWLAHERGPMVASRSDTQPKPAGGVTEGDVGAELAQHVRQVPMSSGDEKTLPILGRAKGGKNAYSVDQGDILGFTVRPNALQGVRDAYAIEVWDTSMEPALEHGWTCWVHPHKAVRPGDRVVIQLKDGQALVKRLVRRAGKSVIFEQLNPPKQITFKESEIDKIHLILGGLFVRT